MINLKELHRHLEAYINCARRGCSECEKIYGTHDCPENEPAGREAVKKLVALLESKTETEITEDAFLDLLKEGYND